MCLVCFQMAGTFALWLSINITVIFLLIIRCGNSCSWVNHLASESYSSSYSDSESGMYSLSDMSSASSDDIWSNSGCGILSWSDSRSSSEASGDCCAWIGEKANYFTWWSYRQFKFNTHLVDTHLCCAVSFLICLRQDLCKTPEQTGTHLSKIMLTLQVYLSG